MRIERIETQVVEFPWGPPEDGITRKWPIHRVVADNGTVGIGRGGNPDLITREFEALLVGEDPEVDELSHQILGVGLLIFLGHAQ